MEILKAIEQSRDAQTIFIVKEALFCKVYEESAWRFNELIRPYKPNKKQLKKLNMEVISIGFPKTQLDSIINEANDKGFEVVHEEQVSLVIKTLSEPAGKFTEWKKNVALNIAEKSILTDKIKTVNQNDLMSIVKELELFQVAGSTPMQSMQFLVDLQNRIKLVKKMPE